LRERFHSLFKEKPEGKWQKGMCHIILQDIEKQRNAVIAGFDYALLVSFHVEGMLLLCLLLIVTTGSFLYASEFFATTADMSITVHSFFSHT
jgi:hypothetical protein